MPSPASAIRSDFSSYCATRISRSTQRIRSRITPRSGSTQLAFDEPGAVLITEKDAVKCEHLKADGVWCVVVDFRFDADTTARLMRLVLRGIGAACVTAGFIAVIPARYASTRLPGKPLKDIAGKPMIEWVYRQTVEERRERGHRRDRRRAHRRRVPRVRRARRDDFDGACERHGSDRRARAPVRVGRRADRRQRPG